MEPPYVDPQFPHESRANHSRQALLPVSSRGCENGRVSSLYHCHFHPAPLDLLKQEGSLQINSLHFMDEKTEIIEGRQEPVTTDVMRALVLSSHGLV
jgi:hypothetical protein